VASFGHFGRQLGAWLEVAGDAVVSVFYPAGCYLCDQLLTRAIRLPICGECLASFAALPPPVCDICDSPVVTPFALNALKPVAVAAGQEASIASARFETRRSGCLGCLGRTFAFGRTRSYAAYKGRLIRAIVMLKFERIEPLAVWFAERLANVVQREHLAADIVVPAALHRQRESERGYNQADLIAPIGTKTRSSLSSGPADGHQTEAGQAHPGLVGALGAGPWRFCHTTGQPS
jgi:predicted amidophosphoribosyltransferase